MRDESGPLGQSEPLVNHSKQPLLVPELAEHVGHHASYASAGRVEGFKLGFAVSIKHFPRAVGPAGRQGVAGGEVCRQRPIPRAQRQHGRRVHDVQVERGESEPRQLRNLCTTTGRSGGGSPRRRRLLRGGGPARMDCSSRLGSLNCSSSAEGSVDDLQASLYASATFMPDGLQSVRATTGHLKRVANRHVIARAARSGMPFPVTIAHRDFCGRPSCASR